MNTLSDTSNRLYRYMTSEYMLLTFSEESEMHLEFSGIIAGTILRAPPIYLFNSASINGFSLE